MKLINFQKLGTNRDAPRLWIESRRLEQLGFLPGTPIEVAPYSNRLVIAPTVLSGNHVSRRTGNCARPIIDINNAELLSGISGYREVKVTASHNLITVAPSVRAFYAHRHLSAKPPFDTVELFAGGGTLSQAIASNPAYRLVAGVEIEPDYADVWQAAHPEAASFLADVRSIHPSELPAHQILIASVPCTSHSNLGRAVKSLAGSPELGDTGDLFLPVAGIIAARMPLACVFENVPNFGNSLAGQTLLSYLAKLGYHIAETVIDPHNEWGEPQDRKRWVAVATLRPGFEIKPPGKRFAGTIGQYLDAPGEQDKADCDRIKTTIEGLRRHNARHQAQGHGFGFTTINHQSTKVPTLVRSYHKINAGPFVETQHGLRLLRKQEFARLMGCHVNGESYAIAVQVMGQGVQTRVFKSILNQLSEFLTT